MITMTRNQIRRLRGVLRRGVLDISHKASLPPVVIHAERGERRIVFRHAGLAVEYIERGSHRSETVAIPFDAFAETEGRDESQVSFEAIRPDHTEARWSDHGIPQVRQYAVTPWDRVEPVPERSKSWTTVPASVLDDLAEACEVAGDGTARYAFDCIQLRGAAGQIAASDGLQMLVKSGLELPWQEDLLIKASPIFGCKALPRDQAIGIGKTDNHVVFQIGSWMIWFEIQKDLRFPELDRVRPQMDSTTTRLTIDPDDAFFLGSSLDRLPGSDSLNSPVTLDLNGKITIRAQAEGQPQVTELVLARSSYSGSPIRVNTNRNLLGYALRLGFRELAIPGSHVPFVCSYRDTFYAWQPLGGDPLEAGNDVIRIESNDPSTGVGRSIKTPDEPRRTAMELTGKVISKPTLALSRARPTEVCPAPESAGKEASVCTLVQLIQEAETLHTEATELRARSARLVAGLRRHRKQSRLLNDTLKSLRQLRLQDVAP